MQEGDGLETYDPFIDEVLENVANYEQRKQERNARRTSLLQGSEQDAVMSKSSAVSRSGTSSPSRPTNSRRKPPQR